jgi:hypothetical protein
MLLVFDQSMWYIYQGCYLLVVVCVLVRDGNCPQYLMYALFNVLTLVFASRLFCAYTLFPCISRAHIFLPIVNIDLVHHMNMRLLGVFPND